MPSGHKYTTLAVDLGYPFFVKQIYLQSQQLDDIVGHVTDSNTFGTDSSFFGITSNRCSGMNHVNVAGGSSIFTCDLAGRHFTIRKETEMIAIEQLVVLGYRCDEMPLIATDTDYLNTCVELTYPGHFIDLPRPIINEGCIKQYPSIWQSG